MKLDLHIFPITQNISFFSSFHEQKHRAISGWFLKQIEQKGSEACREMAGEVDKCHLLIRKVFGEVG